MIAPQHSELESRSLSSKRQPLGAPLSRRSPVSPGRTPKPIPPIVARRRQPQAEDQQRRAPSAQRSTLESLFPRWLDKDPAGSGPNYLAYSILLLPVALLATLALLAIVVAM